MTDLEKTYLIPVRVLESHVYYASIGGDRKSISLETMENECIEVLKGNGVPVDYITAITKLDYLKKWGNK